MTLDTLVEQYRQAGFDAERARAEAEREYRLTTGDPYAYRTEAETEAMAAVEAGSVEALRASAGVSEEFPRGEFAVPGFNAGPDPTGVGDSDPRPRVPVLIFGPNLNRAGQDKGQLHVHREGCGDCRHYGPGTKYGGDDPRGWDIEARSRREVVEAVYPPEDFDYNPETELSAYEGDLYFAPCVEALR